MKNEIGIHSNIQDRSVGAIRPSHLDETVYSMQALLRKKVILAPLAASILLTACNPFSSTPNPSASPTESPKPVPTSATIKLAETPSPSPTARIEQTPTEIALVTFTSTQDAADRFGVPGTSSALASSWRLAENNTAAVLDANLEDRGGYPLDNPNLHWGMESKIRPNGGVVQAYDKIKKTKDGLETIQGELVTNAQAQALVVNPNVTELDVNGATIRVPKDAKDKDALYRKLEADLKALEAKNQPGTTTLPVDECPTALAGTYTLEAIDPSKAAAAARWGGDGDAWADDPSHWVIFNAPNGDHYAHLLPDTSDSAHWGVEHKIKTAGAVVQAYDKIKRNPDGIEIGAPGPVVKNAQAQALVIHPNVTEATVMEATFRVAVGGNTETGAAATNALWRDSEIKQAQAEVNQQPNTSTLPINECPPVPGNKTSPAATFAPTPSPTPNINSSSIDRIALR